MEDNKRDISLKLMINSNDPHDLNRVTILIREGWNLMYFGEVNGEEIVNNKKTKVVFSRKI